MHVITEFRHRPALRGQRVLIVEDEALVAMLVEDGLMDAGATVLGPACTVEEALSMIETANLDGGLAAAVLDLNLGGRSVLPVADKLASLGVPFVIATGYGEGCDTGGHTEAPLLHKPFNLARLTSAVQELL